MPAFARYMLEVDGCAADSDYADGAHHRTTVERTTDVDGEPFGPVDLASGETYTVNLAAVGVTQVQTCYIHSTGAVRVTFTKQDGSTATIHINGSAAAPHWLAVTGLPAGAPGSDDRWTTADVITGITILHVVPVVPAAAVARIRGFVQGT